MAERGPLKACAEGSNPSPAANFRHFSAIGKKWRTAKTGEMWCNSLYTMIVFNVGYRGLNPRSVMTELEVIAMVVVVILGIVAAYFITKQKQEEDKITILDLRAKLHTLYMQIRWIRDVDKVRCIGTPCRRATDKIFETPPQQ